MAFSGRHGPGAASWRSLRDATATARLSEVQQLQAERRRDIPGRERIKGWFVTGHVYRDFAGSLKL